MQVEDDERKKKRIEKFGLSTTDLNEEVCSFHVAYYRHVFTFNCIMCTGAKEEESREVWNLITVTF